MANFGTLGNANSSAQSAKAVEWLAATGLACQRGGHIVVSGLTFEVRAGNALAIRGPNGSGKTTLLRTLAGYLHPAAGRIEIKGGREDHYYHYIGHTNGVKPRLSVIENVSFWQRYYSGKSNSETAEAALEAFGLSNLASFSAGRLSQGQVRRLGLTRLLAAYRPIWLLDEPSVSLDAASTRLMESCIESHLSAGGIAVASTHLDLSLPRLAAVELVPARHRQ